METCVKNRRTGANQVGPVIQKSNILLVFLILGFGIARGQKTDSLIALLDMENDLGRVNILIELSYQFLELDQSLALKYGRDAFNEAKIKSDTLVIVEAGRILSLAYKKNEKVDSSISILNEILPMAVAKRHESEIIKILNLLGILSTFKAAYDKALQYHFHSLQLRESKGDIGSISISLSNIGFVYYKMRDYYKALTFFQKSLSLKSQVKGSDLGMVLLNISLCYANLYDFTKAKTYLKRAIHSCTNGCSKEISKIALYSSGVISIGNGDLQQAERQLLSSYSLAKEQGDQRLILDNIILLSNIYIGSDRLELAEKYLNESQDLIKNGVPYNLELIKVYRELYSLYNKSKNYKKVVEYQDLYIKLKDRIYCDELTTNLMKIEANYLERENRSRIEAQNKILTLNKEVIFRQRIVNTSVGVAAVFLILLSFVLIRSNIRKRLMNQLMELKVKERTIELEQNQLKLLKTLDERALQFKKLSRDVNGSIATIRGLCSLAITDSERPVAEEYLDRIEKTADRLIRHLKGVSF